MDNSQRQEEILNYLKSNHFASISELATAFFASEATIRRDIQKLASKGLVKSFYGGVAITEYQNAPVPINLRDKENSASKEKIALSASKLIKDNSTIIFDSSSTVRRICKYITNRSGLTVITSNLRVCEELRDSNIKVICTGGTLVNRRDCFTGHLAEATLRKLKADAVFFSSQGISENGDITDSSEEETSLRKVMFSIARDKYFLCDPSKRGKSYPFMLCNTEDITEAIYE